MPPAPSRSLVSIVPVPISRIALVLLCCSCTTRDQSASRGSDSAGLATDSLGAGASESVSVAGFTVTTRREAPAAGVEYYPAAMLNHVAETLSQGSSSGHTLGARDSYQYVLSRRTGNGVPEVHERWVDVTVVQAGRGSLVYGGRVSGGTAEADGEHRGGLIRGGTSRPVGAGDLMIITAGVPHQYRIAAGDSLRYITVKVRAPAR